MDAQALTDALGGKWHASRAYGSARCPAHDDTDPSLSISERDGKLLVKCHTGCSQEALIERLRERRLWPEAGGTSIGRLRVHANGAAAEPSAPPVAPPAAAPTPLGRIVERYDYHDAAGKRLFQSVRFEPKAFRQRRPDGKGNWAWSLGDLEPVLYRLPELLAADPKKTVYIVEGEKDADRLAGLGLVATTNPMGAGKWRDSYNASLKDRHVAILPDNDDTGREHAETVAQNLAKIAASVRVVTLPGLLEKGDVSDWLSAGGHREALETLVSETAPRDLPQITYPIRTLAELMASREDISAQLVEGLVWRSWIHWLFARANSGKTVWALVLGLHIAAGKDFCERKVEQGPVLFISEDSPDAIIQEYIETLCELYQIDYAGLPFYVNGTHGLRIENDEGLGIAREAFASCPEQPVLVIVDSCESLVPSDKYTPKEFDPFGRWLRWMADQRCAVIVIDHARKEVKENERVNLLEKLYGSMVKAKVADLAVFLDGSFRDGKLIARWAKFRGNFPPPLEINFHSDTGFELRDLLGKELSPTEQRITKWFNNVEDGWYESQAIWNGAEVAERTAERALPHLVQARWLLRRGAGGKQGYEYRRNPDAGKVFR